MIEIRNVEKSFDTLKALDNVSCQIESGSIFGVVGSNGAGKSTLLRLISGVYSPDAGTVQINGQIIFNNAHIKKEMVFLSDTPITGFGRTIKKLMKEYNTYYPNFSISEYTELVEIFKLDENALLSTLSKGMLNQAMVIIALSCNTKYIVMDETMDGLDAMIRTLVKKRIYSKVLDKNTTVVISSHSLKELEDFCDSLVLIHKGQLIYKQQLQDADTGLIKVQTSLKGDDSQAVFKGIDVLKYTKSGSVVNLIIKGKEQEVVEKILQMNPVILESVPLTLEEIFTYELQERGYAIDSQLMDSINTEEK